MEGVGSRQSRASARYAASPSAPVFNGPVRRWKKQWVTSQTNGGGGGGGNTNRKNPPPLLLCRWTPLSSSTTAAADEPPRRRFRYAPIVPIERGNVKTLEKDSNGGRRTGITTTTQTNNGSDIVSESDGITLSEKPSNGEEEEEALEPNEDQADSNKAPFHGFYPRDEKRAESNEGRKMMS